MKLASYKKITRFAGAIGIGFVALSAVAALGVFSDPEKLSENSLANKTKLVRMGNGWLVSAYGDAAGPDVYDTKKDAVRRARDIFVKVCNSTSSDCSVVANWIGPVNLSNTASLSSIDTDWNEDPNVPGATPFYGDSDKPNIFVSGSFAVVTWVDKYCEGNEQRMISYVERDGITVPFSCVYAAYTNNVAGGIWNTQQLTDGSRDAKSDSNKGLSIGTPAKGSWAISWQEDPHGLQIGGADGPGDGASGAAVTHGTDVWYTFTEDLMGTPLPWAEPVRISDNYTVDGSGGNTSPVFHPSDPLNEIEELERGNTGAARPNLMLVGGSTPPTAVIAYEESKGADRTDSGKFIRYHEFAFNNPPVSTGQYLNGEPGCIISDPLENSRRVRFVSQPNASPNGLRMGVFWRQGLPTEGGPGDIMVRVGKKTTDAGSTGLRPEDMYPAVDTNSCRTSDYTVAKQMVSVPASNISSNTVPWSPVACDSQLPLPPANDLVDTTSHNPYEDARAHRAAIVGDDLHIGYSYTKDWAVATYTDMDNYNFWLRRFSAVDDSWTEALNVSNIEDPKVNVKEPRLVKTPGTGPGCDDGTNLENCQDKNTLVVAWGTESNVYSHVESSEEFDIYYTRTRDKGATFEDTVVVPGLGINNRFESQLRPTPAGNIIYSVWNEADNSAGGTHAMLSISDGDTMPPIGTGIMGDYVWEDLNGNGIQDSSEPGMAGVSVELQSCTGSVLETIATDALGQFRFTELAVGDYQMRFVLPTDYHFSSEGVGSWSTDSNADPVTGLTPCLSMADGQVRLGVDAGMVPTGVSGGTAAMGDFVWSDNNGNGVQDSTESGLSGVTVELLSCTSSSVVETLLTGTDGHFIFDQLEAGTYRMRFTLLSGYVFSPVGQGGDYTLDSNANVYNGLSPCLYLGDGQQRLAVDAGMIP